VIACRLRTKIAAFDPHVQQPDSEDNGSESLEPDENLHAEIVLARPDEPPLTYATPPSSQCFEINARADARHTICIDEIEGEYNLHHEYGMIQVQLLLHGLYDGRDDETETINNGILV
jgi:hypothetical protein